MRRTTAIWLGVLWVPLSAAPGPPSLREMSPMDRSLEQAGFERVAEQAGVEVYKDERAEVIRVGAEGRLAATPAQVREVLLDYDQHVGHVARLSESRILERGEHRLLVYQRLNLPVIDDRDFNLEVTWGDTDTGSWLHWRAVTDLGVLPVPGVVRVSDHEGSWQLERILGTDITRARFQVRLDVAGLVPRWMVRSGAADELPEFFTSVRVMLVLDKIQGGAPCASSSC